MTQLTNEERARIFGMYINQSCYHDDQIFDIHAVHSDGLISLKYNESLELGLHILNTRNPKLILTPLSKITDEHAIEVAKIWKPNYENWEVVRFNVNDQILVRCKDYQVFIYFQPNECMDFEELYSEPIEGYRGLQEPTSCDNIVDIIDRLRELGYVLPYKGQSLFELGIAIDRNLLKS